MRPASVVREEQREPGLERPEAHTLSVEDLLRNVLAGKLRVPPFQHESKWKARDAQTLFDSVYRGYPIGALLLWQRRAGADRLSYGSLEVSAPDMHDAWWVVDGQQRVHALARALAGTGLGSDGFALHFDLVNDRFVRLARRSQETKDHVPLTEVLDSERLLAWLRGHGIAGDARAIGLGKRIREYQVPVYVVRTADEAVVREIYRRVTSTGRSMRDSDVFDAMHGARKGARVGGPLHEPRGPRLRQDRRGDVARDTAGHLHHRRVGARPRRSRAGGPLRDHPAAS